VEKKKKSQSSKRLSVRDWGATGDGVTDDSVAIQRAIDTASQTESGAVWFPPGIYQCASLKIPASVGLFGTPLWTYHKNGATVLRLCDASARALLDLSGSQGVRISGLALDGGELGEGVCGIFLDGGEHNEEETLFIEKTRVAHFTGDGIHLVGSWGFTLRESMIIFNNGDGLTFSKWDGWIYDNIFNNNKGYGIHARPWNASLTITGNRIEWNDCGGICIEHGSYYGINNNFIDRSGGPGILIRGTAAEMDDGVAGHTHSITGNIIHRSGAKIPLDAKENCHVWFENQAGLVFSGNSMASGKNDSGTGQLSPSCGIRYGSLKDSIIKDNTLYNAATCQLIDDMDGLSEECIIKDNPGRIVS